VSNNLDLGLSIRAIDGWERISGPEQEITIKVWGDEDD